jgi:LacI family transcriptional regulator
MILYPHDTSSLTHRDKTFKFPVFTAFKGDYQEMNIRLVADYAGVSIATVSNVIHGKPMVKETTRDKVLKAIQELNYTPNAIAQSLKVRRTKSIGVLISDISNPFFPTMIRGIEDVAKESGYNLILCNTDER